MNSRTDQPYRIVDLFAGCGGFSQGFREYSESVRAREGGHAFVPVAGVEIDPAAALTYVTNFTEWAHSTESADHRFHLGDITDWVDVVRDSGLKADVILGGPPCQGFSGLGKEDPEDPRNQLWEEYFKVVELVQPRIFIIENVDRFRSSEQITELTAAFAQIGYTLEEPEILNAADYGAAQVRRRTIVIGVRGDQYIGYPGPTHTGRRTAGQHLPIDQAAPPAWRTLRECLRPGHATIPNATRGTELPMVNDEGTPTVKISRKVRETGPLDKDFVARLRESIPGPFRGHDLHVGRTPTELSLARYRAILPGQNRKALTEHDRVHADRAGFQRLSTDSWDRHVNGSGDVMGRLEWDKPSVTIRTEFFKPEKGRYLHPEAPRPLSHLEAARIQGFPDDFRWCGSKTQIARQIGNAVPVPLAKALAAHVHDALERGAGTSRRRPAPPSTTAPAKAPREVRQLSLGEPVSTS
ncbi:DNA cytosine methyltransferase [Streptomyces albidoflavus]